MMCLLKEEVEVQEVIIRAINTKVINIKVIKDVILIRIIILINIITIMNIKGIDLILIKIETPIINITKATITEVIGDHGMIGKDTKDYTQTITGMVDMKD